MRRRSPSMILFTLQMRRVMMRLMASQGLLGPLATVEATMGASDSTMTAPSNTWQGGRPTRRGTASREQTESSNVEERDHRSFIFLQLIKEGKQTDDQLTAKWAGLKVAPYLDFVLYVVPDAEHHDSEDGLRQR